MYRGKLRTITYNSCSTFMKKIQEVITMHGMYLFMNEENASGQFGVKYLNKCNEIREKTKIAT